MTKLGGRVSDDAEVAQMQHDDWRTEFGGGEPQHGSGLMLVCPARDFALDCSTTFLSFAVVVSLILDPIIRQWYSVVLEKIHCVPS